ncbi:Fic family protein [Reyranella sp.]|uniref:Fic family protein n=1 Tax=Reyranella sp. TaxID=1929291 RepID=UPI003D0DFEF8
MENEAGPMGLHAFDLGGAQGGLPSAVALPSDANDQILLGEDAFTSGKDFALVTNWKLLLGKTDLEVMTERRNNDRLNRALERATLDKISYHYFEHILKRIMASGRFESVPEFVIGIPSAAARTGASRTRYRRAIEKTFLQLNAPKPRFFLEPFAVFQYHLFNEDIKDTGQPQNVLVVDIGGGTTNVCVIQTSHHGRLARGGENHKPHGVQTFDIGGSDIDTMILNRVVRSTRIRDTKAPLLARKAKESISKVLNSNKLWMEPEEARAISQTIKLENQGDWEVTGHDLIQIVERNFWPSVRATIVECLTTTGTRKDATGVDKIDVVIFAGGTCQIQFLHDLFQRDFSAVPQLLGHRFVVSSQYDRAVASGLALEACANSRLHDLKPTRVAPYLQSSVHFEVGHSLNTVGAPVKLQLKEGPDVCSPKGSTILNAPFSITELVGQQVEWQFQLRQQPDRVSMRFYLNDDKEQPIGSINTVKVAKKGELAGSKCKLRLMFHDDGVADVGLVAWNNAARSDVYFESGYLDLHELHGISSDVFVGMDFGTTNTFVAEAVARPDHHEALPSRYEVDSVTMERAHALQVDSQAFLQSIPNARLLLSNHESNLLKDYVYHSNRIEGSILTRGQTQRILRELPDEKSLHARNIQHEIEEIAFVDDEGEIRTVSRPVRDQVAAVNLRDAFNYVRESALEGRDLSPFFLKSMHNLVVRGETAARPGQFRNDNVKISHATFVPPDHTQVEHLISEMCDFFASKEFQNWPPVYQATYAHARFVSIHPFQDGNGRLARLVANYFLWRANQPSVMLPWENRNRYYDALEECNSYENRNRGSLADLAALFCDLFEDAINNVRASATRIDVSPLDEPVISTGSAKSKRLNALLEKIGSGRRAIDVEAQYSAWQASFTALLAEVKESAILVSSAFRERWGGGIDVREFPIIDLETFRSIKDGGAYSRTWFLNLKLKLPRSTEDIVFYFGRASMQVCRLDNRLERTASLGISRFNRDLMKHVNVHQESWSRIKEITHDGATMGLCSGGSQGLRFFTAEESDFSDWFAVLLEDATEALGGFQLEGLASEEF